MCHHTLALWSCPGSTPVTLRVCGGPRSRRARRKASPSQQARGHWGAPRGQPHAFSIGAPRGAATGRFMWILRWPHGGQRSGWSAPPPAVPPSFPLPEAILNAPEPQAPELKILPQMACGKAAPGYFSGLMLPGSLQAARAGRAAALCCSGPAGPARPVHSGPVLPDGRVHQPAGRGQSPGVPEPSPHSREADSAQREGQAAPRGHGAGCHGGLGSPLTATPRGPAPPYPRGTWRL